MAFSSVPFLWTVVISDPRIKTGHPLSWVFGWLVGNSTGLEIPLTLLSYPSINRLLFCVFVILTDRKRSSHISRSLLMNWPFPGGSEGKASACNAGDLGSISGSGRSHGEGNGYPLQYSCLENSMDRGAWWATVCGVTKSHTQLSN